MELLRGRWVVVEWKQLGRTVGIPTANISTVIEGLDDGTYKVNVIRWDVVLPGAGAYFGERGVFEVHIFDFDEDIYGEDVEVVVLTKIRDNKKFGSVEKLVEQVRADIVWAKEHVCKVMTFGTFDKVHPGHASYLRQARAYGDSLITVVGRDSTIEKVKWKRPVHGEEQRMQDIEDLGIADKVVLGYEWDHYQIIRDWQPDVIALGYDQRAFVDGLEGLKRSEWLSFEVVRMDSYQPEVWKSSKL